MRMRNQWVRLYRNREVEWLDNWRGVYPKLPCVSRSSSTHHRSPIGTRKLVIVNAEVIFKRRTVREGIKFQSKRGWHRTRLLPLGLFAASMADPHTPSAPRTGALSLYANLLDPSPSSDATISRGPVVFKQDEVEASKKQQISAGSYLVSGTK
jgi:hypothetical protein